MVGYEVLWYYDYHEILIICDSLFQKKPKHKLNCISPRNNILIMANYYVNFTIYIFYNNKYLILSYIPGSGVNNMKYCVVRRELFLS